MWARYGCPRGIFRTTSPTFFATCPVRLKLRSKFRELPQLSRFIGNNPRFMIPDLSDVSCFDSWYQPYSDWELGEVVSGWSLVSELLHPYAMVPVISPDEVWEGLDLDTSPGVPWCWQYHSKKDLASAGITPSHLVDVLKSEYALHSGIGCFFRLFRKDEIVSVERNRHSFHKMEFKSTSLWPSSLRLIACSMFFLRRVRCINLVSTLGRLLISRYSH